MGYVPELKMRQLANINRITKNLFLGNWSSSIDPELLKEHNIRCIIGLNTKRKTLEDLRLYKKMKITYLHVSQYDTSNVNIYRIFPITNRFIYKAVRHNKNILIHCSMGISRASTTLIAFLLWAYYLSDLYNSNRKHRTDVVNDVCHNHRRLQNIIDYVKYFRRQVNPNQGFIRQLQVYETNLISRVIHRLPRNFLNNCFK